MAGQEYRPIACYRHTGGNPVVIAGSFSLVADNGQSGKSRSVTPVPVFRDIMAQPLTWLMLITIAIGMCLMNGYEIFKVQPCFKKAAIK